MNRYRWRTRMRRHMPWAFNRFVPKGKRDCGDHEWYNADDSIERCYHCIAERPYDPAHFAHLNDD